MSIILRLLFVSVLILGVLSLTGCSAVSGGGLQIGSAAPDFTLRDLNGQQISLSDYAGTAVFINFWTTTCGPCVEEMPYFQELYDDWLDQPDRVLLTVNLGENSSRVKSFLQSHSYSFPVLLDSSFEAAQKYRVQYTPTSVLIGPDGTLKFSIIGAFRNKAAVEKQVDAYLSK